MQGDHTATHLIIHGGEEVVPVARDSAPDSAPDSVPDSVPDSAQRDGEFFRYRQRSTKKRLKPESVSLAKWSIQNRSQQMLMRVVNTVRRHRQIACFSNAHHLEPRGGAASVRNSPLGKHRTFTSHSPMTTQAGPKSGRRCSRNTPILGLAKLLTIPRRACPGRFPALVVHCPSLPRGPGMRFLLFVGIEFRLQRQLCSGKN